MCIRDSSDPVGPHLLPVVEHDRDCEAQVGAEFPDERPGNLDAEMPGVVDADGFVPEPLPGLAVSAQEHPPVGPQRLPRLDAQVCLRQVVSVPPQPSAARDHTRPARRQRGVHHAQAGRELGQAPGLAVPLARAAVPGNLARSAASARTARSYWSWVARVIEPAHRDDDCAVRYFLRTLRERARPWASSFPWLSRVTRSARYNDPRNVPTSRSACSSAGVGRRRVLIVTPDGGETTNDSASTRSMGYTVSPSTDNARNNNNTRAQTRAWPTKALYCSLKCTRLATVCSPCDSRFCSSRLPTVAWSAPVSYTHLTLPTILRV